MKRYSGPDPDFPFLGESDRYVFPPPESWSGDIVAVGGNLSPGMLISAYEQGIFPWYNPGDPVIWQSPDPRMVIFPEDLRVSKSMRKVLQGGDFEISFDRDFAGVIRGCSEIERPGQDGTWIDDDIIAAYVQMHRLGLAHSAEAYLDGELVGGCYGIRFCVPRDGDRLSGGAFFGESMFARRPNASKAAFLSLALGLFADGVAFIDCQVPTPHLCSLGGREMARMEFLALLRDTLRG